MNEKEKFAFRNVKMSEGVEVEFIKLLASVETKSDADIIGAFKEKLSSDSVTCHSEMLVRTTNKVIFQISKFSRSTLTYRDWEIWVFVRDSQVWTLNRIKI